MPDRVQHEDGLRASGPPRTMPLECRAPGARSFPPDISPHSSSPHWPRRARGLRRRSRTCAVPRAATGPWTRVRSATTGTPRTRIPASSPAMRPRGSSRAIRTSMDEAAWCRPRRRAALPRCSRPRASTSAPRSSGATASTRSTRCSPAPTARPRPADASCTTTSRCRRSRPHPRATSSCSASATSTTRAIRSGRRAQAWTCPRGRAPRASGSPSGWPTASSGPRTGSRRRPSPAACRGSSRSRRCAAVSASWSRSAGSRDRRSTRARSSSGARS